jgi:hypothetical protein
MRLPWFVDAATQSTATPSAVWEQLYATAWKPWTTVEAVDRRMGAISEKP